MAICTTCGNEYVEGDRYCPSCGTSLAAVESARDVSNEGPQLELAHFGRRAAGFLLDIGIVVLLGFIPFVWVLMIIFGPIAWLVFNSIGWSPGKRILGMRIVQEDGRPPGFGRAVARTYTASTSLIVFGLGYFWPLGDVERQTWHDKFAGTHVVRWNDGYATDVRNALEKTAAEPTLEGGPFGDSSRTVPAEFMVRWGGYTIDSVVYGFMVLPLVVLLLIALGLTFFDEESEQAESVQIVGTLLYSLGMLVPLAIYNSLGWSPGKRSLDLRLGKSVV